MGSKAPLTIMASVPALPVIHLPPTICPALQVLYTRMPALCSGIWGPCQTRAIQDMASPGQEGGPLWPIWLRAWQGGEEGESGWYRGLLVPV